MPATRQSGTRRKAWTAGTPERGRGARRSEPVASPSFIAAAAFLVVWVLLGGAAPTNVLIFMLLAVSGSAMAATCVAEGGLRSWQRLAWPARAMLLFFCLMPLLQLVPLPPVVWHALPGRELATGVAQAAGIAGQWRPLTLSVEPTLRTALVFGWLAAFLLLLLQLSFQQWHRLLGILLALGLLNIAIGIVQVISGNPALQLYDYAFYPYMDGLFANKNHNGLFIALTFLSGYAWLYGPQGWDRSRLAAVVPVGLFMAVALLVTFSRAAVVLGAVAVGFLVLMSGEHRMRAQGRAKALGVSIALVVLLVAVSSTDLVSHALSRFEGVSEDTRWQFTRWSWPLIGQFFPFGAGVGSFTTVFPPHEQLSWVAPTYVNHVHDDYLEQLIEVGIAAPIAWLVTVAAVAGPVRAAWVQRTRPSGRLALIGAAMLFLIAAHSTVDYPLRRPGIAVTFVMALAAVLRVGNRVGRDKTEHDGQAADDPAPAIAVRRGIATPAAARTVG